MRGSFSPPVFLLLLDRLLVIAFVRYIYPWKALSQPTYSPDLGTSPRGSGPATELAGHSFD